MRESRGTPERLDPLLVADVNAFDQETLALRLARYQLAAEFVRDADVVDCACATGYGSELLAQAGARQVQAVDLDRGALAFARARHAHPAVTYYEAAALRFTPLPTCSVWVSLETLEHLPNSTAYVSHVAEVLKPGGLFIVSAPVTVSTDGNPRHLQDHSRASLRSLLAHHGFTEERALEQSHRFGLLDAFGGSNRARLHDRRQSLVGWYARHPKVLAERLKLTFTKGLVNEYLTVVARRQ